MKGLEELARLLVGTVVFRPYVYAFFACFLVFALRQLRGRGTAVYLVVAWTIAFLCEYSSTRNGFPFGIYVYLDATRTRELWISNVPFWDSLSFVFLSYFSWRVAAAVRDPRAPERRMLEPRTALLAGLLMMLLDVVIDPVTLLGDRWFLGRIYYYPNGGAYFGVTLSNFAGWFFVGAVTVLVAQWLCRVNVIRISEPEPVHPERSGAESKGQSSPDVLIGTRRSASPSGHLVDSDPSTPDRRSYAQGERWAAFGVYAGVFAFNLAVTAWIGEWKLFAASAAVAGITCGGCVAALRKSPMAPAERVAA